MKVVRVQGDILFRKAFGGSFKKSGGSFVNFGGTIQKIGGSSQFFGGMNKQANVISPLIVNELKNKNLLVM